MTHTQQVNPEWRPSLWLRTLAKTSHSHWPVGMSIRSAIGVAAPLLIGSLLGYAAEAMWVGMGALLLTSGERAIPYGERFRQALIVAPIAASGLFLGTLSSLPAPAVVAIMAAIAFATGIISGYSGALSTATMMGTMTAVLAIGVHGLAPYWHAALLFLGGSVVYLVMLGIEAIIDRKRPRRRALATLLQAIASLADQRAKGTAGIEASRDSAIAAMNAFESLAMHQRGTALGPTRQYERATMILRATDQLLARLMAHDASPQLSAETAKRLQDCAHAVMHGQKLSSDHADGLTLTRLAALESAMWGPLTNNSDLARPLARKPKFTMPGRNLVGAAARTALCIALAFTAYYLVPIERPYWIVLTVVLVMKPDFGSVFGRAVLRSAGTVIGAVVAMLVGMLMTSTIPESIAIALLAACLPWAKGRSYATMSIFLTPLVMLLLNVVVPHNNLLEDTLVRVLTTIIGGAIVIVAGYLIWPRARHARVAATFDGALHSLAEYAKAVASRQSETAIARGRDTTYGQLSDANVALQRSLAEPPPAGTEALAWLPVVSAAERVADRITDADASRPPLDISADPTELMAIAKELDDMIASPKPDRGERVPQLPTAGIESTDPTIRSLAEEVAHMGPMLTKHGARRVGGTR